MSENHDLSNAEGKRILKELLEEYVEPVQERGDLSDPEMARLLRLLADHIQPGDERRFTVDDFENGTTVSFLRKERDTETGTVHPRQRVGTIEKTPPLECTPSSADESVTVEDMILVAIPPEQRESTVGLGETRVLVHPRMVTGSFGYHRVEKVRYAFDEELEGYSRPGGTDE